MKPQRAFRSAFETNPPPTGPRVGNSEIEGIAPVRAVMAGGCQGRRGAAGQGEARPEEESEVVVARRPF